MTNKVGTFEVLSIPKCVECGQIATHRIHIQDEGGKDLCYNHFNLIGQTVKLVQSRGVELEPLPVQSNMRMGLGIATKATQKEYEEKLTGWTAQKILSLLDDEPEVVTLPNTQDIVLSQLNGIEGFTSQTQLWAYYKIDGYHYQWRCTRVGSEIAVEDTSTGNSVVPTIESWAKLKCAIDTKYWFVEVSRKSDLNYQKFIPKPTTRTWTEVRRLYIVSFPIRKWPMDESGKGYIRMADASEGVVGPWIMTGTKTSIELTHKCEHCGSDANKVYANKDGDEFILCQKCSAS